MQNMQESQKEALANYKAITETWDTEQAVEILQKHNWDVTEASNEFFSNTRIQNESLNMSVTVSPRKSSWEKVASFIGSVWKSIVPEEIRGETSKSALEFSDKIKEICSSNLGFSNLRFSEMLSLAYDKELPVFIYIHDFSFDYPRDLFTDARLVNYLNKEYVYWGVENSSHEGNMLKNQLGISNFPYFAIFDIQKPSHPIVKFKHEGYIEKQALINALEDHCKNADPRVLAERRLRETQEKEFREAERLAHEREVSKKVQAENQARAAKLLEIEKQARLKYLAEKIGSEPGPSENAVVASFRLSSGKRIDRSFLLSSSCSLLFEYLESQGVKAKELATGIPVRIIENIEVSLEQAGITHQCVIHVRE